MSLLILETPSIPYGLRQADRKPRGRVVQEQRTMARQDRQRSQQGTSPRGIQIQPLLAFRCS